MPSPIYRLIDERAAALARDLVNAANQTKSFSTQPSGSYIAARGDSGQIISVTSGNVYITPLVFNPGDTFHIHNSSNSQITITQNTNVTIYYANLISVAATPSTGNRTLGARGYATLTCVGANTFVISTGSGVF